MIRENRREASKKETRRLILRAARRLLARRGVEDCTLRDVAREAGVSPASVVVHFKSKTGLLEAALDSDIDRVLVDLMASLPTRQGLLASLLHLGRGFLILYDGNRPLYRALIRRTLLEPWTDTPHMAKLSARYVESLANLVEAEKNRGRIRSEIESRVAAGVLFSLYLGALVMLFRHPEAMVDRAVELLKAMTTQYLTGIEVRRENTADPASETGSGPRR
jgi:AcrR family transcriptional regulator